MRVKSWNPGIVIGMARANAFTKLNQVGEEMVTYIKQNMISTPLDYSKPYVDGEDLHFPSQEGAFPAVWSKELINSLEHKVVQTGNRVVLLVGVNLDKDAEEGYAVWLEYGTTKMAARPYLTPTLFQFESRIMEILS